jgi:cytosine/adenosine deaminase-related metal-dependent hydrolase
LTPTHLVLESAIFRITSVNPVGPPRKRAGDDGRRWREIADGGLSRRRVDRAGWADPQLLRAPTKCSICRAPASSAGQHPPSSLSDPDAAIPAAQDADLFHWLRALYPIWARLTPEDVRLSTQIGLAELALSGCTTASDHLYLFPNGSRLDDEIEAAGEIGLRLHASRGSMSLGESRGGLPPDSVVESEERILSDCRRVIEAYHQAESGAMVRIVVAPCSPFSVTPDLMRESAALARAYRVRLHTHLAETLDEERFCLETFGRRPLAHVESLDWNGDDVWFAHAVHMNPEEAGRMGSARTGVAHCPSSNMRLASGIAPVRRFQRAGVPVGLGVDGSASTDSSHMLAEARQALLLSRLGERLAPTSMTSSLLTARYASSWRRGGASVLGATTSVAQPGRSPILSPCGWSAWSTPGAARSGGSGRPVRAGQGRPVRSAWSQGRRRRKVDGCRPAAVD